MSARIHVAPVFAPARIQEKNLVNYLCIGFVPGANCGEVESEQFGLSSLFSLLSVSFLSLSPMGTCIFVLLVCILA